MNRQDVKYYAVYLAGTALVLSGFLAFYAALAEDTWSLAIAAAGFISLVAGVSILSIIEEENIVDKLKKLPRP